MLVIVSYDIVDTKMRTKLAKKLLNYGKRVQFSVFECKLDNIKLKEMKNAALPFIDKKKDSLRIYKICELCAHNIDSIGIKKGIEDDEDTIVI